MYPQYIYVVCVLEDSKDEYDGDKISEKHPVSFHHCRKKAMVQYEQLSEPSFLLLIFSDPDWHLVLKKPSVFSLPFGKVDRKLAWKSSLPEQIYLPEGGRGEITDLYFQIDRLYIPICTGGYRRINWAIRDVLIASRKYYWPFTPHEEEEAVDVPLADQIEWDAPRIEFFFEKRACLRRRRNKLMKDITLQQRCWYMAVENGLDTSPIPLIVAFINNRWYQSNQIFYQRLLHNP